MSLTSNICDTEHLVTKCNHAAHSAAQICYTATNVSIMSLCWLINFMYFKYLEQKYFIINLLFLLTYLGVRGHLGLRTVDSSLNNKQTL